MNCRKVEEVVEFKRAERPQDDRRAKEAKSRSPIQKEDRGPNGRKPTPALPDRQLAYRLVTYKL